MALPPLERKPTAHRSWTMGRVRAKDTGPELTVRKRLFGAGFRYRLHVGALPGRPDIVLPKHRVAIQVHGCFWHGHGCKRAKRPISNKEYWEAKLAANVERDRRNAGQLSAMGWRPVVIWECSVEEGVSDLIAHLRQS